MSSYDGKLDYMRIKEHKLSLMMVPYYQRLVHVSDHDSVSLPSSSLPPLLLNVYILSSD